MLKVKFTKLTRFSMIIKYFWMSYLFFFIFHFTIFKEGLYQLERALSLWLQMSATVQVSNALEGDPGALVFLPDFFLDFQIKSSFFAILLICQVLMASSFSFCL